MVECILNVDRLRSVIGFGVGAGANILAQFAVSMKYLYYVMCFMCDVVKLSVFRLHNIIFQSVLLHHYYIQMLIIQTGKHAMLMIRISLLHEVCN